ncbi:MAG: M61 family metallopeptidase, partial [Armatimonadetes bacterium]|nr:M61 family metallopeptidase [Armatimonadota bacterium]
MLRHLLLASVAFAATLSQADISYTAQPDPASQKLQVTIHVDKGTEQTVFRMPVWSPGFYFVLNFQDKVSDVRAIGEDGSDLKIEHSGARWAVQNPSKGALTLRYKVLGDDQGLGFFRVHIGPHDCFVNGSAAFMYAEGRKEEPCRLKVYVPQGWRIATPMDPDGPGWRADTGYDEFVDHPLQMGKFERRDFEVEGIPFSAIYVANDGISADLDDSAQRLKVCSVPAIKLFGTTGFKRYMYIVHLSVGDFAGGLEHRASNVIAVPNSDVIHLDELGTHEYFHAWNVKQIRPKVLGPFDYTQKVVTGALWFSEGVTDYYAQITAHRAKVHDDNWLFQALSRQIQELQRGTTRKTMTVEECSREAWRNGFGNVGDLSYYNKGLVAGLIFDAAIRAETKGQKSLDDVMRLLYQRYHLPQPGFGEDDLRATISEVAGADLGPLYDRMIRSTDELPYEELKRVGLRVLAPGDQALGYGFETSNGAVT